MLKTYAETLDFLYENLPMFQRIGAAALKPDLHNTIALCERLGNPHQKFKTVHVAGTNGKGSTSHILASVFQSAGYTTGLYTSPHLKSFTERIRINGTEMPELKVIDFVNRIRPAIEELKPSFFEITVAMAFDYFAAQHIDIAIIEVGLGGRLDSTNIITPELSVITNIGWDHMDLLGDTLEKIAAEKAGIIKSSVPVVVSEKQSHSEVVFRRCALEQQADIYFASDHFSVTSREERGLISLDIWEGDEILLSNLVLPLQGYYQQKNVLGVVQAVKILQAQGWKITNQQLRNGLENVTAQTGLKGRWQVINEKPLIVCDTGHNLDGIQQVLRQLQHQSFQKLFMVFGMVQGKDVISILKLLPKDAYYYFCEPKIPRALNASTLVAEARKLNLNGEVVADVNEAIAMAKKHAHIEDMIFVGGSTYVVAEVNDL